MKRSKSYFFQATLGIRFAILRNQESMNMMMLIYTMPIGLVEKNGRGMWTTIF